jgi:hypothetical protein
MDERRQSYLKRIYSPDKSQYVDIPVIYNISFIDAKTNGQEYGWSIDNISGTDVSTRKTHVQRVVNQIGAPASSNYPAADAQTDPTQYVDVERIDLFNNIDAKTLGQEYGYRFNNKDPLYISKPGDTPPPRTSHIVRYYKNNDPTTNVWVDCQLIDELPTIDPKSSSQELTLRIQNAKLGDMVGDVGPSGDPYTPTIGNVDLTLPAAPESGSGIDPPYRLDPFQNIVNVNWSGSGPRDSGQWILWMVLGAPQGLIGGPPVGPWWPPPTAIDGSGFSIAQRYDDWSKYGYPWMFPPWSAFPGNNIHGTTPAGAVAPTDLFGVHTSTHYSPFGGLSYWYDGRIIDTPPLNPVLAFSPITETATIGYFYSWWPIIGLPPRPDQPPPPQSSGFIQQLLNGRPFSYDTRFCSPYPQNLIASVQGFTY